MVIIPVAQVLAKVDSDTRIIPGHGPLSNAAELKSYHAMLVTVRDRVQVLVKYGASLEVVITADPTAEFDGALGGGFIRLDKFVEIVFQGLQ